MTFRITFPITSIRGHRLLPRKPAVICEISAPNDSAQRCISSHPDAEDQRRITKIASAAHAKLAMSGVHVGTGLGMKSKARRIYHGNTRTMVVSTTRQSWGALPELGALRNVRRR